MVKCTFCTKEAVAFQTQDGIEICRCGNHLTNDYPALRAMITESCKPKDPKEIVTE